MAFNLRTLDYSRLEVVTSAVITGLSALSFIQFKPSSKIPLDEKVAPAIRVIGYGLLGLAGYQLYRSIVLMRE